MVDHAPSTTDDADRCIARTRDGERCSRPATDGEFCYQHGPADETVDDETADAAATADGGEAVDDSVDSPDLVDELDRLVGGAAADGEDDREVDGDGPEGVENADGADPDEEAEEPDETVPDAAEGAGEDDPTAAAEEIEAEGSDDAFDLLEVRRVAETATTGLIGRPFDGISEIRPDDDGWTVVVEVIERRAVPDTQDILGRYELELGPEGTVRGYRRTSRYRRSDTADDE